MSRRYYAFVGPIVLLAAWSAITYGGLVRPILVPEPHEVAAALVSAVRSAAFRTELGLTVYRWLAGVVIGSIAGALMGLSIGISHRLDASTEFTIDFFRSLPVITLFPLLLLVCGTGNDSKIVAAGWASFLFVTVNTTYGVRYSKHARSLLGKVLRASQSQLLWKIIFPDALPAIFSGLRVSISLGLVVVIATEMIMGTREGLGKRILDDALIYEMPEMYASIVIVGGLGYIANKALLRLEKTIIHWSG